jgi:Tfp pilus assembly protein PilX
LKEANIKQRLSNLLRIVVIVALVFGLLSIAGLRVAHPKSGLRSALGAAETSIAVYHKTTKISKGERIVVDSGASNSDPALAVVNNVSGDDLDIQINSNLVRVSVKKDLHGKLIAVVPFVGYVLGLFGK